MEMGRQKDDDGMRSCDSRWRLKLALAPNPSQVKNIGRKRSVVLLSSLQHHSSAWF
jgi:hypothetical protein